MPESISLLLWQNEAAASCQLGGNKWVGEELLFDASEPWNASHFAFKTTEGSLKSNFRLWTFWWFGFIRGKHSNTTYQKHRKASQNQTQGATKNILFVARECRSRTFAFVAKLLSDMKENSQGGLGRTHTQSTVGFIAALLCWLTRQMTFFEYSMQRSQSLASRKIFSAECHLWLSRSLYGLLFVWLTVRLFSIRV